MCYLVITPMLLTLALALALALALTPTLTLTPTPTPPLTLTPSLPLPLPLTPALRRWQRRVGAAEGAAGLAPHVLRLESAVRQLQRCAEAHERKPWRLDGCEHVGCRARRFFELERGSPMVVGNGTITGWLPEP